MEAITRRREIAGVPAPTGPFSWSVAWGDLLFISGLRGIVPETGKPAEGDEERLELIMSHLKQILLANSSAPYRVLSTRVYVTSMARHRPLVNAAFERFFGTALPTRTIVEVAALNQEDTIEVEVIAARAT